MTKCGIKKKKKKDVVCIHPWSGGFMHLPDFIYRCRLILSLDGHRDGPSNLNLLHPNATYTHAHSHIPKNTHTHTHAPIPMGRRGWFRPGHKDKHYSSTSLTPNCWAGGEGGGRFHHFS